MQNKCEMLVKCEFLLVQDNASRFLASMSDGACGSSTVVIVLCAVSRSTVLSLSLLERTLAS